MTDVIEVAGSVDEVVAALTGKPVPESTSTAEEPAAPPADAQAASEEGSENIIEDPEEEKEKPAKGGSQKLQKLLEKYGGDEDKLVEGIYEQWNSAARLHRELEDLKNLVISQNAKPEEVELESPDVQEIKEELTDLKAELESNNARKSSIITTAAQFNEQIAELRGEAKRADEFEKTRLEGQIDRLITKRESLASEWKDLDKRNKEISKEERDLQKRARQAEQTLEEQRLQLKETEKQIADKKVETIQTYTRTFQEEVSQLNIPEEKLGRMYNAVRRDIREYLESLGPDAPEQDMVRITKAAVADYVREYNIQKRTAAAQKVTAKLATTEKAPVATPTPAPAKASQNKLPEGWAKMSNEAKARFASQRASQILGG